MCREKIPHFPTEPFSAYGICREENIRNFLLLKMFLEWTINYEVPSSLAMQNRGKEVLRKNLVDIWHKLFTSVADSRAPVKTLRVRGFSTPWMNPSISEAMRDRADYHHKQARSSKSGIRFANSVTLCVVRLTKQNPSFIPN